MDEYAKAPFKVSVIGSGSLWGMSHPGSFAPLQATVTELYERKISSLVCLQEHHELAELGLRRFPERCLARRVRWIHFPLRDKSTPEDAAEFAALGERIFDDIVRGANIAVHCHAGIGRTGMLISSVLGRAGHTLEEAHYIFSAARGFRVPETSDQYQWMARHWTLLTNPESRNREGSEQAK